jgi:hypothetical protein
VTENKNQFGVSNANGLINKICTDWFYQFLGIKSSQRFNYFVERCKNLVFPFSREFAPRGEFILLFVHSVTLQVQIIPVSVYSEVTSVLNYFSFILTSN